MDFTRISKFALSPNLQDVKLSFTDSKEKTMDFPAHKIILSGHSHLLHHMCCYYPKINSIQFPALLDSYSRKTEFDDVEKVIRFLYSNKRFEDLSLSKEKAFNYFVVAELMGIDWLKKEIGLFIEKRVFSESPVFECLFNSIKFGEKKWIDLLLAKISTQFSDLVQEEESKKLEIKKEGTKKNTKKTEDNLLEEEVKEQKEIEEHKESNEVNQEKEKSIDSKKSVEKKDQTPTTNREKLLKLPFQYFMLLIQRNDLNVFREEKVLDLVIDYIKVTDQCNEASEQNEEIDQKDKYDLKNLFSESYLKKNFKKRGKSKTSIQEKLETKQNKKSENKKKELIRKKKKQKNIDLGTVFAHKQNWNVWSLEQLKLRKLKVSEKRALLNQIRYPFIDHSCLVQLAENPIFKEFSDILLEGLSSKLNKFEASKINYKVNCASRDNYRNKSKIIFLFF